MIILKKVILYIHGKGGNAKEAEHYNTICSDYDVIGLDYKTFTPWETREEILAEYELLRKDYDYIMIIANSIGAYFAMNALSGKEIKRAIFISPIVNMEKLILDMMTWADVTEQELQYKQEIETSFGETLSWQYLCYVRKNPIIWNIPTDILYAGNDNMTSYETISKFAKETNSALKIMRDGEHWFHTEKQLAFLDNWLKSIL
ncbi:MAG: alpha/beta hydrolase [Acutalibacteraceae bacterium]